MLRDEMPCVMVPRSGHHGHFLHTRGVACFMPRREGSCWVEIHRHARNKGGVEAEITVREIAAEGARREPEGSRLRTLADQLLSTEGGEAVDVAVAPVHAFWLAQQTRGIGDTKALATERTQGPEYSKGKLEWRIWWSRLTAQPTGCLLCTFIARRRDSCPHQRITGRRSDVGDCLAPVLRRLRRDR